jgi:hypothetical protein
MVQLQKSEISLEGTKEVTQFTLDFQFTRPESTLVQRAPVTVSQR